MVEPRIEDIRNIAIVGHGAVGKTTLSDLMLFKSGIASRVGSVDDGTSLLDTAAIWLARVGDRDRREKWQLARLLRRACPVSDGRFRVSAQVDNTDEENGNLRTFGGVLRRRLERPSRAPRWRSTTPL